MKKTLTEIVLVSDPLTRLFDDDKDVRRTAELSVHANPVAALTMLNRGREKGALSLFLQGKIFEAILAGCNDSDEVREAVDLSIGPETAAELLATVGTLPGSVAAALLDPEIVLAAILIAAEGSDVLVYVQLLNWIVNLIDRDDWENTTVDKEGEDVQSLLDREIGDHTLRDLIIAAVLKHYNEKNMYEDKDQKDGREEDSDGLEPDRFVEDVDRVANTVPADLWAAVGLDPTEAEERLQELLGSGLPEFDDDEVEEARRRLRMKAGVGELDLVAEAAIGIEI